MDGLVCEKCWLKVEIFHEFYIRIEEIHSTLYKNENIFVDNIDEHLNITLDEGKSLIPRVKNENSNHTDDDEYNQFNENNSNDGDYVPEGSIYRKLPFSKFNEKFLFFFFFLDFRRCSSKDEVDTQK